MKLKGIKMTEQKVFAGGMAEASIHLALKLAEENPEIWSKVSIADLIRVVASGMLSGHISTLGLSEKITEQKVRKISSLLNKALAHSLQTVSDLERAYYGTKEGGEA